METPMIIAWTLVVLSYVIMFGVYITWDNDTEITKVVLMIFAYSFVVASFGIAVSHYDDRMEEQYKQGQIDAINGDIKYHQQLKVKTDTVYKKIGE